MWRLVGGPWCEATVCGGWLVGHGVRARSGCDRRDARVNAACLLISDDKHG